MGSIGCWSAQRVSVLLLSGIASFASMGCSLAIDPDRQQCASNSECAAFENSECSSAGICESIKSAGTGGSGSGGAMAVGDSGPPPVVSDWSCIGKPQTTVPETGPFRVVFKMTGVLGGAGIPGVTGKLCAKLDVECKNPVQTAVSDPSGFLTFEAVSKNYSGWVWFTPSPTAPEEQATVPGLYFFNRQIDHDYAAENATPGTPAKYIATQLATPGNVTTLTALAGVPQRDGNSLTLNNVYDCAGKAATGVRFKLLSADEDSSEATIFYAKSGVPTKDGEETDTSGYGGIVNATPEALNLEAFIGPKDAPKRVGSITFFGKPNSLSYMRLVPDGF